MRLEIVKSLRRVLGGYGMSVIYILVRKILIFNHELILTLSNLTAGAHHHHSIHIGSEGTATSGLLEHLLETHHSLGKSHTIEHAHENKIKKTHSSDTVLKKTYLQMLHKLNLFMVPKEVGEVEREDFKMEDWERDCWRGGGDGREVRERAFEHR